MFRLVLIRRAMDKLPVNKLMEFKRITENQAYDRVVRATDSLRRVGMGFPIFEDHPEIQKYNFDYQRCATGGFGICGEGEYSGLIVIDGDYKFRVISIFIDRLIPEDTEIVDITKSLGKFDPENPRCDIRNSVSMSIIYYLEQFGEVPVWLNRYIRKPNSF